MDTPSHLLKPLTLPCGVTVSNRLLKSAMSEGFAHKDHAPNALHEQLYQTFAEGGTGIVITGNVMIDSTALGEPGNVVIEDDRHMTALKRWAKAGQTKESALWVQLNHPGKQAPRFITNDPVAPSAIPLEGTMKRAFKTPRALTDEEIKALVKRFATSAKIVKDAGFSGVQIHAAHGYLMSQFLSPKHNQREAPYGGDLKNRMRFLIEVYEAMREAVGDTFPIGVKMNIDDFIDGGFSKEDANVVMRVLSERGIDLIELSGGSYETPVMMGQSNKEGFFLDSLTAMDQTILAPRVITGGFRSKVVMESVIEKSSAEMIGLARPLVINPDLVNHIQVGSFESMSLPRIRFGVKRLDRKLGPIVGLSAYELAMKRLAKGKTVKISTCGWRVLGHVLIAQGVKAFIRRRPAKHPTR